MLQTTVEIRKGQRGVPGALEVRIPHFHCCGLGSLLWPGWGTEIPQANRHSRQKKKNRDNNQEFKLTNYYNFSKYKTTNISENNFT